jgi:hypothetical protein
MPDVPARARIGVSAPPYSYPVVGGTTGHEVSIKPEGEGEAQRYRSVCSCGEYTSEPFASEARAGRAGKCHARFVAREGN